MIKRNEKNYGRRTTEKKKKKKKKKKKLKIPRNDGWYFPEMNIHKNVLFFFVSFFVPLCRLFWECCFVLFFCFLNSKKPSSKMTTTTKNTTTLLLFSLLFSSFFFSSSSLTFTCTRYTGGLTNCWKRNNPLEKFDVVFNDTKQLFIFLFLFFFFFFFFFFFIYISPDPSPFSSIFLFP